MSLYGDGFISKPKQKEEKQARGGGVCHSDKKTDKQRANEELEFMRGLLNNNLKVK